MGIGPDAEIFTKAPVLASVGHGERIGIRRDSAWNNPEPEVVLAVDARGGIVGATLGNDVNLRDYEGRSALLLPEAKDNNASSAIGPFIRLFEPGFTLDDLMATDVELEVRGPDGFVTAVATACRASAATRGRSSHRRWAVRTSIPTASPCSWARCSCPPRTGERRAPGSPITRVMWCGSRTRCSASLVNEVGYTDALPPWTMGIRALWANVAARS